MPVPAPPNPRLAPIPDGREKFAVMRFPIYGTDVSMELEGQRAGTTPIGSNVRTFEALTQRGRGGSRPGLRKFVTGSVATIPKSNPQAIQNLTVVVDPFGQLMPFPFDNVAGFTYDNLDISNLGRATLIDGSIGDVYEGGSGNLTNTKRRPVPKVTITPNDQTKVEGTTFTFVGTEFAIDSGITAYQTYTASQVDAAQAASDKANSAAAAAQAIYNADPTDAHAAYLEATTLAATLAGVALAAAQGLKALADASTVTSLTLTSTGSVDTAEPGTYPIKGKEAVGVALQLYRLRYATGTMTVTAAPVVEDIVFVQANISHHEGAGSTTVAYSSNVTAGNLLVVFWGADFGTVSSVTDTLGNTYTNAGTAAQDGSSRGACWYCINATTGANTVTVASSGSIKVASVLEYSGVNDVTPVENYQRSNNNSVSGPFFQNLTTPTVQTNPGTTTLAADILTPAVTSVTVTSSATFPTAPFTVKVDTEQLRVTNVAGTTWTVTRGFNSTTAATHTSGATVTQFNRNLKLGMFTMFFDNETFVPMLSPAATVRAAQNNGEDFMAMWVEEIIDTSAPLAMTGVLGGLGALNGAPAIGIAFKP